ncbi:MAG: DUF4347 domain-containing protein [Leptolyngbya sp. IPPAS B-1204]
MTSCRHLSTLVVVDSTVVDYESLVNSTKPGTAVLVLDAERDGIEQISQALAEADSLESLHILSHGSAGVLQLGSTSLNWQTLRRYAAQLQAWAKPLAGAEILLYGCKVAAGAIGQWFVRQLKSLTGAEIAASTNLTGSSVLGGDWNLEFTTGEIRTPLVFLLRQWLAIHMCCQYWSQIRSEMEMLLIKSGCLVLMLRLQAGHLQSYRF